MRGITFLEMHLLDVSGFFPAFAGCFGHIVLTLTGARDPIGGFSISFTGSPVAGLGFSAVFVIKAQTVSTVHPTKIKDTSAVERYSEVLGHLSID